MNCRRYSEFKHRYPRSGRNIGWIRNNCRVPKIYESRIALRTWNTNIKRAASQIDFLRYSEAEVIAT